MNRVLGTGTVAFACALALGGCGGAESSDGEPPAEPTLPAALAEELAAGSDEVAALLEAGDGCGAAERSAELGEQAIAAVEDGRVPDPLAEPLLTAVSRLADQIVCASPPVEAGDDDDDDAGPGKSQGKGKGKAKGKDKGKGGENDDDDEEQDD